MLRLGLLVFVCAMLQVAVHADALMIAIDGHTMVKLRAFSYQFEADTNYDAATDTYCVTLYGQTVYLIPYSTTAWIGGTEIELEFVPVIVDGVMYVPLRFLCNTFNLDCTWGPAYTHVIIIDRHTHQRVMWVRDDEWGTRQHTWLHPVTYRINHKSEATSQQSVREKAEPARHPGHPAGDKSPAGHKHPPAADHAHPTAPGHAHPTVPGHEHPTVPGHAHPTVPGHEHPSAAGHGQPPAVTHDQPPTAVHGQPLALTHNQPPTVIHGQPPAVTHDQPPSAVHGQPLVLVHNQPPTVIHEQPPAFTHAQPPAFTHNQPPASSHELSLTPAHRQSPTTYQSTSGQPSSSRTTGTSNYHNNVSSGSSSAQPAKGATPNTHQGSSGQGTSGTKNNNGQ